MVSSEPPATPAPVTLRQPRRLTDRSWNSCRCRSLIGTLLQGGAGLHPLSIGPGHCQDGAPGPPPRLLAEEPAGEPEGDVREDDAQGESDELEDHELAHASID